MAHYAKVENGIVTHVVVVGEEYLDEFKQMNPGTWVQTSYNTFAGQHALGGTPLRKNFAGVGYLYDEVRDAFIPQRVFSSWVLNEDTCQWEPPIPYPTDGGNYVWNELERCWHQIFDDQVVGTDIPVTNVQG